MKIHYFARFLVVILLLAIGSTSVLAHTPDQCGSVEPIRPGDTVTDAVSDVPAAHIDITDVETSLSGERLTVVFHLRDLPETLKFNRMAYGKGTKEYEWEVAIDVDNDRSTGPGGFDMLLTAYHIAFLLHEGVGAEERTPIEDMLDADVSAPLDEMLEVSVWETHPDGSTSSEAYGIEEHSDGSFSKLGVVRPEISTEEDTITFSGVIPGITSASRLAFGAYDVQFAGEADQIACHDSYRKSVGAWGCSSGAVLIAPGQTVIDDVSDVSAAYPDIVEVSTSLAGETLTVVFHFRDVPETFTFDRSGVPEEVVEYSWEVSVDVDGDQESGFGGIEYILSSIYVTPPVFSGRDRSAAITTDDVQTNTWVLKPAGGAFPDIDFLSWGRIEVSAEEDTITLSGEIPGITADSRLSFGVYDYLGGEEEIGCLSSFRFGRLARQSPSDGPAAVSDPHAFDDVSHELVGHIDIGGVTTEVDGETLTVTFLLRDVPEMLTFDRTGVPAHALEYSWEVSIDVDNSAETGAGGFDYMLSAGYVVHPLVKDSNTAAKITEQGFVRAGILGLDGEGNRVLSEADIEVSAEENRITLSGEIPGITGGSPLRFKAFDYFEGSVEKSSHGASITGVAADTCGYDSAVIRPGQKVLDAIADSLPAYIDITEVSSALTGDGRLVAVIHLRDVPETLEFNRKGVPKDALEYNWEVSIDVDEDLVTGLQGAEYSLSASHFVFTPSSDGSGVHLSIGEAVQANSWKLEDVEEGGRGQYVSDISLQVSHEEDTITLIGDVPGITPESRLAFKAYDYRHGDEQVACQVLSFMDDSE